MIKLLKISEINEDENKLSNLVIVESKRSKKINGSLSQALEMLMKKIATANCQELIEIIKVLHMLKSKS